MKINKHNLEIAKHCAREKISTFATDVLHFTSTGTSAACRCFAIWVTALAVENTDKPGTMSVTEAMATQAYLEEGSEFEIATAFLDNVGPFPDVSRYDGKTPVFRIDMGAEFLLQLTQATVDFGGESVRIEFTAPDEPTRWLTTNAETGQQFEALLMPRKPR